MGHYNHSIPVQDTIMVSTNCPIIGEQVAVNFVAQQATIATVKDLLKTPFNVAFSAYNSKTNSVTPICKVYKNAAKGDQSHLKFSKS